MSTLPLTPHAKARRKAMGVTEHAIERALYEPETTYSASCNPRHRRGRTCYQRDDIVVIVNDDDGTIVTVLWNGAEGRDEEGRPIGERRWRRR